MSGILYEQRAFCNTTQQSQRSPSTIRTCGNAIAADSHPHIDWFGSRRFQPDVNFYLVRHGDAVAAVENAERPLSRIGRRTGSTRRAEMAGARKLKSQRIYHSGILRAKQTAEILAKASPAKLGGGTASPAYCPKMIRRLSKPSLTPPRCSIMLVGHLPYLNRLAALLISGDPERAVVEFSSRDCALLF